MEGEINNYEDKPTISYLGMIIWTALIATIFGVFWFAIRLYFCYGNLQCIFANDWVRDERYKREQLEKEKNKKEDTIPKNTRNPASEYCIRKGWISKTRTLEDGTEYWRVCQISEWVEYDELYFYILSSEEEITKAIKEKLTIDQTNNVETQKPENQNNENDKEWIIVKSFIDLPLELAIEQANILGLELRVMSVDGNPKDTTLDYPYPQYRINVDIEKNIVKRVSLG